MIEAVLWSTLLKAAVSTAGSRFATEGISYFREAVGFQAAERLTLNAIRKDVEALLKGPWMTGENYLAQAADEWRTEEERAERVATAERYFEEARGNLTYDPYCRALVDKRLALCAIYSGSQRDAERYLTASYNSAIDAMEATIRFLAPRASYMDRVAGAHEILGRAAGAMTGGKAAVVTFGALAVGALVPPVGMAIAVGITLGGVALAAAGVIGSALRGSRAVVSELPAVTQALVELDQVTRFIQSLPSETLREPATSARWRSIQPRLERLRSTAAQRL